MIANAIDQRIEAWDKRSKPYIIVAAIAPVFTALALGKRITTVHVIVDMVAWVVFVADLLVRRSIDRKYLRTGSGIFDTVIIVMTVPWYLLPGVGGTEFMSVFRLARLARLVSATGLGASTIKVLRRLGTLGIWLGATSVIAALIVMQAEPPESGFETFGDALWWAMVSFTTVGYGDLFPVTPLCRFAGMLMMLAGLAALGTVAAVLGASVGANDSENEDSTDQRILSELRALRGEVEELRNQLDDD